MNELALRLEHSVDVDVSPGFAWRFRTDVANWDDPPARFTLEGAFAAGSWGTTVLPGQAPVHWRIADVRPYESFLIEVQLDGATLTFEWRFQGLSPRRTRMSQCIALTGENASAYAEQIERAFGTNLADGMNRIAAQTKIAEMHMETSG
jgi:hypothetical protein